MSPLKKRSPIWEYFEISSVNTRFAVCMLCRLQISRGGEGKKAGTSAMRNHIKSKHPEKFRLLNKDKDIPMPHVEPAFSGTSSFPTSTEMQLSLSEPFERKLFWDVKDTKANKYDYLIAEMVALDNEPLDIVDKVGFKRLLQNALPHYELPSRTYISQKIIPDIHNRIFEKIKARISGAVALSVTCDVWRCLHNNSSFQSFTAHWLSPEFQLQHGVLAIKPFLESHTQENITNELNSIAARWGIEERKIHILVHDSRANMVKGVRETEYDFAQCFIHSLQRVVTESLKIQSEVIDMIATSRRLVTHFNHSGLAQEKLLAIQKDLNLPEHQLVQDISARWNSTFYMEERLLEQRRAISLYVAEHNTLNNLTSQQWGLMEQCVMLLKPFEEITKITSSGLSCISEVIPHIVALRKYLEKDETVQRTADLLHMRNSLKAQLESCFNSIREDNNYLIATFLDPRFKTSYLGTIEAERARQKILLEYLKMTCDESSCSGNSSASSSPAKRYKGNKTDLNFTRDSHDIFWDCFNEVADENNSQFRDQDKNTIASEIDYYLKTIRIDRNHDLYNWWSVNCKQYPILSKFARVYLSAPCSSVFYSERLFSEPGLAYENELNRLLPENSEILVFIHHNLPLINFEY